MTIPTDSLHDRDVRALASRAVLDAKHTAKEALRHTYGSKEDLAAADAQITRMVYQDKRVRSWRVWGAFWAFVAGVLAVPEVQQAIAVALGAAVQVAYALAGALSLPEVQQAIAVALGATVPVAYAPLVPGILAVIWPLVSKYKDTRPVRGEEG